MAKIKMKSHSGSKKRFKKTASGKIKCKKQGTQHLLEHKSSKRMRRLNEAAYLSPGFEKKIAKVLPYL